MLMNDNSSQTALRAVEVQTDMDALFIRTFKSKICTVFKIRL